MTKEKLNLQKEKTIKRQKHQRLMTKEKLNLQKEEKTTKRKKHQSLMSKDKLIMLKKIDNYRKRKASEPDEQREAKLAKRRENYQKRKAFQETVPIQEQSTCDSNECDSRSSTNLTDKNQYLREFERKALQETVPIQEQSTCDSNECDSRSSTNLTDKNQYLREFDADKNGELHLQQWAKVNMSKFHKSLKYTTLQCTICKEAWPLKATKRSRTNYVCMRCTRDKKCPKAFSSENSLTPSKVPPQLQGLTKTEEMLIARALPIMRVHIKPGGQRGYSGHCINLPQDIKELLYRDIPRT